MYLTLVDQNKNAGHYLFLDILFTAFTKHYARHITRTISDGQDKTVNHAVTSLVCPLRTRTQAWLGG